MLPLQLGPNHANCNAGSASAGNFMVINLRILNVKTSCLRFTAGSEDYLASRNALVAGFASNGMINRAGQMLDEMSEEAFFLLLQFSLLIYSGQATTASQRSPIG